MSWATKFFQNQGWLGIAKYGKDSNGNITGFVDANGNPVVPITKTLTQFLALTAADVADGAVIHITNVHTTSGAGGVYATWDATASKWGQNFGVSWVFSTLALAVASFPAASFTGWRIYVTGVGELRSNGTRYVPATGRIILGSGIYGTLSAPTKNSGAVAAPYSFSIGTPTIPANLLAAGSMLNVKFRTQRHNANATLTFNVRLGTAGTTSDPLIWQAAIAATNLHHSASDILITFPDTTHLIVNMTSSQAGTGGAGQLVEMTTNIDTTAAMILSMDISAKNAADTLDLLSWYLEWFE